MTMDSGSAGNVISSYRKRQQRGPFIIWGIAALLVIVGIIVLVVWLTGDNKPNIALFATETPTPTLTFTPTITPSPTATATMTFTPTMTLTPTPSAPFSYIIQEGESLAVVAEKFELGNDGILLLLALNPLVANNNGIVFVGQEILVPNPGMELPTPTLVPADLPTGTLLNYTIQPGDTIAAIAAKFNSTADAIIEENELENANAIFVGQVLIVPANLITPEPTRLPPTADPGITATPTQVSAGGGTTGGACDYEENSAYVAQIFTLVNDARSTQGLSPLGLSSQLTDAALIQASDMACNSLTTHTGSDGSSPTDRVAAQGYTASFVLEEIHAQPPEYGGDGQAAFDIWIGGGNLLNPAVTEIGIAYAYFADSALGGYFVAVLAAP